MFAFPSSTGGGTMVTTMADGIRGSNVVSLYYNGCAPVGVRRLQHRGKSASHPTQMLQIPSSITSPNVSNYLTTDTRKIGRTQRQEALRQRPDDRLNRTCKLAGEAELSTNGRNDSDRHLDVSSHYCVGAQSSIRMDSSLDGHKDYGDASA
jgi:hypothetical protein